MREKMEDKLYKIKIGVERFDSVVRQFRTTISEYLKIVAGENNLIIKVTKSVQNANKCSTFALTVLTTLPDRSASQGESFAFIDFPNYFRYTSLLGGFSFSAIKNFSL